LIIPIPPDFALLHTGYILLNQLTKSEVMTTPIASDPIPLETDAEGVMRVGKTRVTLDTVIAAFVDGATAEEIVQQYPSLNLADVYAVIAYYLRRRSEVEAYLQRRRDLADKIQTQNESRFDPSGVRNRLLARRASKG
jgi:uncharacterized protein (DUF433 family)